MLKKRVKKHLLYQQGFDGNKNGGAKDDGWGILDADRKFSIKNRSRHFGVVNFYLWIVR
jgi:hypothetical protein